MLLADGLRRRPGFSHPLFQVRREQLAENGSLAVLLPGHLRTRLLVAEVFEAKRKPPAIAGRHHVTEFVNIVGLAVRRQSHYLVFITELPESQVLAHRRVIEAEGVWKGDRSMYVQPVPFPRRPH